MKILTITLKILLIGLAVVFHSTNAFGSDMIIDHKNTNLSSIPLEWINKAKADLNIAYNHTSHGSQLITEMNVLAEFPDYGKTYHWSSSPQNSEHQLNLYDRALGKPADLNRGDKDTTDNGIADWAEQTAQLLTKYINQDGLQDNFHTNIVMWSWCNITGHNIPRYLNSMKLLVKQFGKKGAHPRAGKLRYLYS